MKAVMLSIQPWWCELIEQGMKTVEVRKTRPKLEPPFKCYIYCTLPRKSGDSFLVGGNAPLTGNGMVIGEFVCDEVFEIYQCVEVHDELLSCPIERWLEWDSDDEQLFEHSCLTHKEIASYLGKSGNGYGWHISDLVIYDRPKELSEFLTTDNEAVRKCEHRFCGGQAECKVKHGGWTKGSYMCTKKSDYDPDWCEKCKTKPITRPPQSWCYVEEMRNAND